MVWMRLVALQHTLRCNMHRADRARYRDPGLLRREVHRLDMTRRGITGDGVRGTAFVL
jgi:hypothetical protein